MVYTKKKFKELWESNDNGGGITLGDVKDCAKDWGLYSNPTAHNMSKVLDKVLNMALQEKCGTVTEVK